MNDKLIILGLIVVGLVIGVCGVTMANYLTNNQQETILNVTNNSSAMDENNSTVAPVKQVNNTTSETQKTTIQNKPKQIMDPKTAHKIAQRYMDEHYGYGYSVAYGGVESGLFQTIFYGPNADTYGNICQDPYTGRVISVTFT